MPIYKYAGMKGLIQKKSTVRSGDLGRRSSMRYASEIPYAYYHFIVRYCIQRLGIPLVAQFKVLRLWF